MQARLERGQHYLRQVPRKSVAVFKPALFILLAGMAAGAASELRPYIAVVEKVAGAVDFYTEDGRRLGRVQAGAFPHEAVLSRDGHWLYVSNNGVLWMTEDKLGTNSIAVIDVRSMKKVRDIDLGRFHRPHGIALLPGSERLLATTERPFGLILIDPGQGKVVRDFDVKGKSPHMVMPTRDGHWAFVSNVDSDNVAAIDLKSGAATLIPTGARPQGGVFSPGGERLFITNTGGNKISIIDVSSKAVTGEIPTGKGPARIAISPDGRTLIYNLQFEPGVGFADVSAGKQVGFVALPGRPLSLTMTKDGARAFAGIQDHDKIAFISVAGRSIERILDVPKGSGPDPAIHLQPLPEH